VFYIEITGAKTKKLELVALKKILRNLKKDNIGLEKTIQRGESIAPSLEIITFFFNGMKINKLSDYYFHLKNELYWEAQYPRNTAVKKLIYPRNISNYQKTTYQELTP
jgi:hypothetical protein